MFEMSLTTMFLHDYELSAKSWQKCTELSQWSPTMYAYLTGCCYLELYRSRRIQNSEAVEKYKKLAREFIRKGPPLAGRQKVMSKELPFDTYVCRKGEFFDFLLHTDNELQSSTPYHSLLLPFGAHQEVDVVF